MISLKTVVSTLTAVSFGLVSLAAHAAGECDKYTSSYDQTYCMAKLFVGSDNELNTVYNQLRNMIGPDVKQELKQTQLEWIKYRDAGCSSDNTIAVDCSYQINRKRTEYLRARLRECKAGACRNDMITGQSWSN